MVINHCQTGWPDISSLSPDAQQFVYSRIHLTAWDGLLMYGTCSFVPFSLRTKIFDALYDAHQGIVKYRERVRSSVWWSKFGKDSECMVTSCLMSTNYSMPLVEPLLSSSQSDLLWQKVATNFFELNGKHFLIAIDFFSRFIKLIEFLSGSADCVITALKSSCHDIGNYRN